MKKTVILIGFLMTQGIYAPVFKKINKDVFYKPLKNPFKVTQKYGQFHNGIDLITFSDDKNVKNLQTCIINGIYETPNNTPVLSCKNEYYEFRYLHISPDKHLRINMEIRISENIGIYNNKGLSNGDHIHIIIIRNTDSKVLNPEKVLNL